MKKAKFFALIIILPCLCHTHMVAELTAAEVDPPQTHALALFPV